VFNTYIFIIAIHAVFIHSNTRVHIGWLRYVFTTPQYHHWHHCIEEEYYGKNFAVFFPFIDKIFGTFYLPKDKWPEGTGLSEVYIVKLGVESIRKLLIFKALFLPIAAAALFFWAISAANGLGAILEQPSKFTTSAAFWAFFFPDWLTQLYSYAWFVGFGVSGLIYWILMRDKMIK
jgi:hypothetical protein